MAAGHITPAAMSGLFMIKSGILFVKNAKIDWLKSESGKCFKKE